jgi:uncharacterized membrane protein
MVNKVIKNALIADKCADSVTKNLEFAITRTRQATHQQKRKDGKMSKVVYKKNKPHTVFFKPKRVIIRVRNKKTKEDFTVYFTCHKEDIRQVEVEY